MSVGFSIILMLSSFPLVLFAVRLTLEGGYARAIFFVVAALGLIMLGTQLWPRDSALRAYDEEHG